MGFSGAASFAETLPHLRDACASFAAPVAGVPPPRAIYLLGHWTKSGASGCAEGMGTPDVYAQVLTLPGCDGGNVRFMMGHDHCNRVWEPSVADLLENPEVPPTFPAAAPRQEGAPGFLIGASGAGWGPSPAAPAVAPEEGEEILCF